MFEVPSIRWALLVDSPRCAVHSGAKGIEFTEGVERASRLLLSASALARDRRGKGKENFLLRAMVPGGAGCK